MACNCCENPYFAGCFDLCDNNVLDTQQLATEVGVYKLELTFKNSTVLLQTSSLGIGDAIVFTLASGVINENYTYTGKLINPNGEYENFTIDLQSFDCIKFQTQIVANVSNP